MKLLLSATRTLGIAIAIGSLTLAGCGDASNSESMDTSPDLSGNSSGSSLPDALFLAEPPEGAEPITALKESAEQGEEVVVRAVVGGRVDPIVEGRASATIVDASLNNTCVSADDHCPTPWDYCCEPSEQLTANLATLQIVDEDGRIMAADLSDRVEPLATVVVRGKVGPRPNQQVLTINATGIYVEPKVQ